MTYPEWKAKQNLIPLRMEFIKQRGRLSEIVSYLNEKARTLPTDYNDPQILEDYITSRHSAQFENFLYKKWLYKGGLADGTI